MISARLHPQTPPPEAGTRNDCWGLAASSVLHVAAIAALSCVWLPAVGPRTPPAVVTEWSESTDLPVEPAPVVELKTVQGAAAGGQLRTATFLPTLPREEPQVRFDQRVPQQVGPLVDQVDLREGVQLAAVAPSTGRGRGEGNGVGDGRGEGRGVDFFPIDQSTGRYVFVVDGSKSMNHPYPGPAKSRLGRVKVELWRTIYRMLPEQKFFIVFFNTHAVPMPATELRSGGTEGQTELFSWTASVRADGRTDPQDALLMAVRMQPDVIYFLTDGEFNYKVVREVSKANFGGIRINTISLGDDSAAKFLEEMATKNGGNYRHIVEEEDHYWDESGETETSSAAMSEANAAQ